jgi:hypothetical protein
MSSKHGHWAYKTTIESTKDHPYPGYQKAVLGYFAHRLDAEENAIQARVSEIAAEIGFAQKQTRAALAQLIRTGYLKRVGKIGHPKGDFFALDVTRIRPDTHTQMGMGQEDVTPTEMGRGSTVSTPTHTGRGQEQEGQGFTPPRLGMGSDSTPTQSGMGSPPTPSRLGMGSPGASRAHSSTKTLFNILKTKALYSGVTDDSLANTHARDSENLTENSHQTSAEIQPEISSPREHEDFDFSDHDFVSKTPLQNTPVNPDSSSRIFVTSVFQNLFGQAEKIGKAGRLAITERMFLQAVQAGAKHWSQTQQQAATNLFDLWGVYVSAASEDRFIARLDRWLENGTWKESPEIWKERNNGGTGGVVQSGKNLGRRRSGAVTAASSPDLIRRAIESSGGDDAPAPGGHPAGLPAFAGVARATGGPGASSGLPGRTAAPVLPIASRGIQPKRAPLS